ncbi:transposase [Streptomyces mirabilis]|uniref:Transposase n=1 Tax=Streptomyces mirabilis TaxID=68239 RepID=A0ABU3V3Y3_9ACTN|nr:transposase [Streptomyces mirabilis]
MGPKGGRREKHPRRRIVDAIFYVVRTGCAWRQLTKDFAPWPTVYWYFTWWHDDGTVERIHDVLRGRVREADGRAAEPSAGLIDCTADTVPAATRGCVVGKKIKGRKRFIVTDIPRPAPGRPRCCRERPGPRRRSSPAALDSP